MTMKERLLAFALEAENLDHLSNTDHEVAFVFDAIMMGEFSDAVRKARGDWEPPDPPGWEGGIADNH